MNNQFVPGSAVAPTSTVEISISCRDLPDKDTLSRSDPICVVYYQTIGFTRWTEMLRTEMISDTLNPDFVSKVVMDFTFEQDQFLRFEIYDVDSPNPDLEQHDFLGFAECKLAQIVAAGYSNLSLGLCQDKTIAYVGITNLSGRLPKNYKGTILLLAEELTTLKEELLFKFDGKSMGHSSFFGLFKPTIFFVMSKVNEGGSYTVVYRSDGVRGENPNWKQATISIRNLCNGDKDRGIKIECYKQGMNGYHKLIGTAHTTVNQLTALVGSSDGISLEGVKGKRIPGKIRVATCQLCPIYTFVEYIQSGTQIHCCFAIDFTASNGDPTIPNSLHHITQNGRTNPYEQAIQAVGEIIQDYDSTRMFPVYGFGARIPPNGVVSHHFPITLSNTPYCNGVAGVLENYRNCIHQVQLYGPTNFAPIIRDVANMAKQSMNGQHYYILLIVTDGIITDMPATKEAIVNAATLPLSILIVGVGGADFTAMEELDGDTVRLSSNGIYAARDIVQFVPFRDAYTWTTSNTQAPSAGMVNFANNFEATARLAKAQLAKEVLAEIPDQLTSFMKTCNIVPNRNTF